MDKVKFTVPGHDGEFTCDADQVKSYKVAKKLVRSDDDPSLLFECMEAIFCGNDEEYIDRLGGDVDEIGTLLQSAVEACAAKNSSASSQTSSGAEAK